MILDALKEYVAAEPDAELSDEENFSAVADRIRNNVMDKLAEKEREIEAAYQKARDELKALREAKYQDLSTMGRARRCASGLEHLILTSLNANEYVDLEHKFDGELKRLAHNCELDMDCDDVYALLFSKKLMPSLELEIKSKADFDALRIQLAENNAAVLRQQHCKIIQDEYRLIQQEAYGDKFAERLMTGFVNLTEQIKDSAEALALDEDQLTQMALNIFDMRNTADIAARWQKAQHKIAANALFQDVDKFDLGREVVINDELIFALSQISFTAKRFKHAMLTNKAEELSALQSEFLDAIQNKRNYRKPAQEMKQLTQILKNPDFIVHSIL